VLPLPLHNGALRPLLPEALFDASAVVGSHACRAVTELGNEYEHLRDPKLLVVGVQRLSSVLPGARSSPAPRSRLTSRS